MNDCFYCENGEKLNSLMIEVCKLDYSTVYLNRDQKHKGRCIVMFKDHKTEYFPRGKQGIFCRAGKDSPGCLKPVSS